MHGGPHTMNRDSWSYRWNTHVLASPGYVVTWVNRHGSTGFGEKFARSIVNEWGDMPFEDIMKSTDYLLARFPNLDKDRLAAAGASYGGYMAAWVLGHTDRFKCDHRPRRRQQLLQPVRDRRAARLRQGDGRHAVGERRRPAAQQPDVLREELQDADARDPHGELDYRVPYGNGLELYGVLQAMGVPSRLVVYPEREPLGPLAAERHLLALGDAELARALHRRQARSRSRCSTASSSSVR